MQRKSKRDFNDLKNIVTMTESVFHEMGLQPGLRNVVDLATEGPDEEQPRDLVTTAALVPGPSPGTSTRSTSRPASTNASSRGITRNGSAFSSTPPSATISEACNCGVVFAIAAALAVGAGKANRKSAPVSLAFPPALPYPPPQRADPEKDSAHFRLEFAVHPAP